jgi:ATP-binding cassette subfamily G (WHITE) protein 2
LTFGVIGNFNLTPGPSVSKFPSQKAIIKRERASGSYRSSSAFLAKFVASLPLLIIGTTIFVVPVYWTIGFQATASQFFTYYFISIVHVIVSNALGFVIGSIVPNQELGQIIAPMIIIVFMLFSGLLVNLDSITVVLRWIQWISFITYSYKAYGQNEFVESIKFTCSGGSRCFADGLAVVEQYSLGTPSLWSAIAVNVGFITFYLALGMILFHRSSAPLSKLK